MKLYKYLHPDRTDVLLNGRIRFTQASALNDPFELSPYFEELVREEYVRQELLKAKLDLRPYLREAYDKYPDEIKAVMPFESMCVLLENNPEIVTNFYQQGMQFILNAIKEISPSLKDKMLHRLRTEIGILSLTEAPDNLLMWSHYADSHKGYLIEFEGEHHFFNQKRNPDDAFYHVRRVAYPTVKPIFKDLMDIGESNLLLIKEHSWKYEMEWRMMVPLMFHEKTIEPDIHLVPFPAAAVTGVVIGTHCSEFTRDLLTSLVATDERYRHVRIYQAQLNHREGCVDVAPI